MFLFKDDRDFLMITVVLSVVGIIWLVWGVM